MVNAARRWRANGGSVDVGQSEEALGDTLVEAACAQALPALDPVTPAERDVRSSVDLVVVEPDERCADQLLVNSRHREVVFDAGRPPPFAKAVLHQIGRVAFVIDGAELRESVDGIPRRIVALTTCQSLLKLTPRVRAAPDELCSAEECSFARSLGFGRRDDIGVHVAALVEAKPGCG